MALDDAARAAKPLPALLTYQIGRAVWLVELRCREYAISAASASEPCGEGLPVRKSATVHGSKLRRKQFGVPAPHAAAGGDTRGV